MNNYENMKVNKPVEGWNCDVVTPNNHSTSTDDTKNYTHNRDWGHDTKYGNKRFGKGRLGHM